MRQAQVLVGGVTVRQAICQLWLTFGKASEFDALIAGQRARLRDVKKETAPDP